MTVPIISHSHEGIRINIDGVVEQFSNGMYVAESYARHKATCRELAEIVRPVAEQVARDADWICKQPIEEHGALVLTEANAVRLKEGITANIEALNLALSKLLEQCRR